MNTITGTHMASYSKNTYLTNTSRDRNSELLCQFSPKEESSHPVCSISKGTERIERVTDINHEATCTKLGLRQ